MLALISFAAGDVASLSFGEPLDRERTPEERVRGILADFEQRKAELLDIGFSPSVNILIGILKSSGDDPATILPPIRALGFLGRPQGAEVVAQHIRDRDIEVRLAAIRSLGQMAKFVSIPLIEPYLESSDRRERREAIIALGKFAKPELIPQIEAAAGSDPELVKLVSEAKERIAATLEGLKTEKYRALVDALIETDEYEDLLAYILVVWRPLQETLVDNARSPRSRERAARLLGAARVRKAGPHMRKILADPNQPPALRLRAAYGIGMTRTRSGIHQLTELLSSSDRGSRAIAILALARLGDHRAMQPLLAQWDADGGSFRRELRLALWRVAPRPADPILLEGLRSYQPRPVETVYFIADDLAFWSGYRTAVLAPYLVRPSAEARRDALLLVASFGGNEDAEALEHHRQTDPDPLNREIANLGLERLKNIPLWERP